jgi:hypothetical protein
MLYNSPFIYHKTSIYSSITSMGNLFILYSLLVLFLHLFILLTLYFILNLIIYPFYPIHPLLHHYSDYSFISFLYLMSCHICIFTRAAATLPCKYVLSRNSKFYLILFFSLDSPVLSLQNESKIIKIRSLVV